MYGTVQASADEYCPHGVCSPVQRDIMFLMEKATSVCVNYTVKVLDKINLRRGLDTGQGKVILKRVSGKANSNNILSLFH